MHEPDESQCLGEEIWLAKDRHATSEDGELLIPAILSPRFVCFAGLKGIGVVLGIAAVIGGALILHSEGIRQLDGKVHWYVAIGLLGFAVSCDVVGRIGCWFLARRSAGGWAFFASVFWQFVSLVIVGYHVVMGRSIETFAFIAFWLAIGAQGLAALSFTTALGYLAEQQGWAELQRKSNRLRDSLRNAMAVFKSSSVMLTLVTLFFVVFPLLLFLMWFLGLFLIVFWIPILAFVALWLGWIEVQYLLVIWSLIRQTSAVRGVATALPLPAVEEPTPLRTPRDSSSE